MKPHISVVIPAYNEEELLPRCLSALVPQAHRAGAEIIVVDNRSTDRTAEVARSFGVRVVAEFSPGYVHALQRGFSEARGDIVAVTDADTVVADNWLERIAKNFHTINVAGVSGPVHFPGLWHLTGLRWLFPHKLWGANMAVRRSVWTQVGGFDLSTNLTADFALSDRLREKGSIIFDRHLKVVTSTRRYGAQPLRQSAYYVANYLWLSATKRPLFWNFDPIRTSEGQLRKQAKRRRWSMATLTAVLALVYWSAWPTSSVFGQVTAHDHTHEKIVALTFDDGPNGAATRTIVGILQQKHAPAAFFEVGRSVAADPATAKFVANAGFAIENHSWDHSINLPVMHPSHIARELSSTQSVIQQATGETPSLFRPPHGLRSPQLLYEVNRFHLRTVDWSVDPHDYLTNDSTRIVHDVLEDVRPGSIVLLHDGLQDGPRAVSLRNRQGTIRALPVIIDELRARGYTIVPLSQLLANHDTDG